VIPVILSGGAGSRLWPLSRSLRPKQFLSLTGDQSLFQMTLMRLTGLVANAAPIIVANEDHRFVVADQCLRVNVRPAAILLEPVARNTAPAIAVAALTALALGDRSAVGGDDSDPVLLILSSDHFFSDPTAFAAAVHVGQEAALSGAMVTFGIEPKAPETGYGYIKAGDRINSGSDSDIPVPSIFTVQDFVEKPDRSTAENYLSEGHYFWNSGIFMFRASVFLGELGRYSPSILAACQNALSMAGQDLDFIRLDKEAFAASPSDSIDYAVMEKTDNALVVPIDAGWIDVGAWTAVRQLQPQDQAGNGTNGDVLLCDAKNSYVHAENRLVALVGVSDLIVVETSDAVLVLHKDKAQDVKRVVEILKAEGRTEVDSHQEVFRPWGAYVSIDKGERYQVKRITVKPGARLSLQKHYHRAEHWVVVKGTAQITIDNEVRLVGENQSVYIPIGVIHCVENPGKVSVELIEVQSGAYLGEDDIVRLDDQYGRN
jgi:mannose-1-phosphate guanylyltransferase/mannose-6-phosphate isomerase